MRGHTNRRCALLAAASLALAAALAAVFWWPATASAPQHDAPPSDRARTGTTAPDQRTGVPGEHDPELGARRASALPDRVAVPHSSDSGSVPGVPLDGRTARLSGRVTFRGAPVAAPIEFVAGLNRGTVLDCAVDGTLEPAQLYPGFGLITLRAHGVTCTRELRLRHRREHRLELDLGNHGQVRGRVCDESGEPIGEALVSLDGAVTRTDGSGWFTVDQVASGSPLLIAQKAGFASHREIMAASDAPRTIVLRRAGEIEIALGPCAGVATAEVYVIPAAGSARTTYPWHLVDPLRIAPGEVHAVDDLPGGRYTVLAFHDRATGSAEVPWLAPGRRVRVEVDLQPLTPLAVRVTYRGEPVSGARAILQAGNMVRAVFDVLGEQSHALQMLPTSAWPCALQRQTTDLRGRATFGIYPRNRTSQYLTVTAPGLPTRCYELASVPTSLTVDLDGETHYR